MTAEIVVYEARPTDLASVLGVLDAAALETDADRIRARIDRGAVLVVVRDERDGSGRSKTTDPGRSSTDHSEQSDRPVLGALVLVGDEIDAVAVRRRRRSQGIGRALIAAAADRRERLIAEFDAGVRPFYEKLGFAVEPVERSERDDRADDRTRYRGVLDPAGD